MKILENWDFLSNVTMLQCFDSIYYFFNLAFEDEFSYILFLL